MFTREQLDTHIGNMREKLSDQEKGVLSDDFVGIATNYQMALDRIKELEDSETKLKNENEELLRVNGKLFQKVGVEQKQQEDVEIEKQQENTKIDVNTVINEKGEII